MARPDWRPDVPKGIPGSHPTCSIEGCDKPRWGRGWCKMHWTRWRRHGDPLVCRYLPMPERVWSKVDKSAGPDGCWLWTGIITRYGYGTFSLGGRPLFAHIWIWEALNGPVPEGLELDHFRCNNPPCVNPAHVRPVTHRENLLRSDGIAARNLAKTHCPQNHPYSEANTYIDRNGWRRCKACVRVRGMARWRQQSLA